MKTIHLVLGLFASSFCFAEPGITGRNLNNLKGATFCIREVYVATSDSLSDTTERKFSLEQYNILRIKLLAYRIPVHTVCTNVSNEYSIFVNFDAAGPIGTNQARNWLINLLISDLNTPKYPDGVIVYSDWDSGVNVNYTITEEKDYIATQFTKMIDVLAANFATTNPLK